MENEQLDLTHVSLYRSILRRVLNGTDEEVDEFFERAVFGDEGVTVDVETRKMIYIDVTKL